MGEGWNLLKDTEGPRQRRCFPSPTSAPCLSSLPFPLASPPPVATVPGLHNPSRGDRVDTRRAEAGEGWEGRHLMRASRPSFSGAQAARSSTSSGPPRIPGFQSVDLRMPLRGPLGLPFPGSPPSRKEFVLCAPSGRCFAIARILPGRHCHPQARGVQCPGGDWESPRVW